MTSCCSLLSSWSLAIIRCLLNRLFIPGPFLGFGLGSWAAAGGDFPSRLFGRRFLLGVGPGLLPGFGLGSFSVTRRSSFGEALGFTPWEVGRPASPATSFRSPWGRLLSRDSAVWRVPWSWVSRCLVFQWRPAVPEHEPQRAMVPEEDSEPVRLRRGPLPDWLVPDPVPFLPHLPSE